MPTSNRDLIACTKNVAGTYEFAGKVNGADYYERKDPPGLEPMFLFKVGEDTWGVQTSAMKVDGTAEDWTLAHHKSITGCPQPGVLWDTCPTGTWGTSRETHSYMTLLSK